MEEEPTPSEVVSTIELELVEPQRQCGDHTAVKTLRLGINLLTNALIFVTVFICLVYACRPKLTIFTLHIILSVIGFQFFLCQGAMAMSPYNGWTVLMKKQHRLHIHWVLQLVGVACVTAGSVLYMLTLKEHFTSVHGGTGMIAVAASLLSLVNGLIALIICKCCSNVTVKLCFKIFHIISGIATLALSAISLCFAFENVEFKMWLSLWFNNDDIPAPALQLITGLFTFLIALDVAIPKPKSADVTEINNDSSKHFENSE